MKSLKMNTVLFSALIYRKYLPSIKMVEGQAVRTGTIRIMPLVRRKVNAHYLWLNTNFGTVPKKKILANSYKQMT